jgi:hypothetical protein
MSCKFSSFQAVENRPSIVRRTEKKAGNGNSPAISLSMIEALFMPVIGSAPGSVHARIALFGPASSRVAKTL